MRALQQGFLNTVRAAINVAGAVENRRRPDSSDLRVLGIDDSFANSRYFVDSPR